MAFLDYDGLKRYTEKFKSWVSGSIPVVTASKSGTAMTISVDGTAIATVNDGDLGLYLDAEGYLCQK